MKQLLLLFVFAFCFFRSNAQDSSHTKRIGILPVPAFGYAPETNTYFGAVSLFTLKLFDDTLTRTSNGKLEFNYTLNKQWIISFNWNLVLKNENIALLGENSLQKFPEYFWGIGNTTADNDSELYECKRVEINDAALKKIKDKLWLGIKYRMQSMYDVVREQNGLLDSNIITGARGGLSSGIGWQLLFDKRNNLLNPSAGNYFLSLTNTFFGKFSGSDFEFVQFELDARKYFRAFKKDILAFQLYQVFTDANAPFRMMPLLGSESIMRGYYRGRFRDLNYLALQSEYRMTVYRRWGAVFFLGTGDVAHSLSEFDFAQFKIAGGGGIRFLIDRKENYNLRMDYAAGKNTSGFYVSFGEAF